MVKIKRQLIILRCYGRLSRGGVICMYLEKRKTSPAEKVEMVVISTAQQKYLTFFLPW